MLRLYPDSRSHVALFPIKPKPPSRPEPYSSTYRCLSKCGQNGENGHLKNAESYFQVKDSPSASIHRGLKCGGTHRFSGEREHDGVEVPVMKLLEAALEVDRAHHEGGLHQRHCHLTVPHLYLRLPPCTCTSY